MKKLFSDNEGNFSSMRVFSGIALVIAAVHTFTGAEFDILLIWIVAAFFPKALQKFAERKT